MMLPPDFSKAHRASLLQALDLEPSLSIRLNPKKLFDTASAPNFEWDGVVDWCADGRYLASRPSFTNDPRHAAGAYYVQEASSMIVGEVVSRLELPQNAVVVELCAAPGGKTTHLSSVLSSSNGPGAVLVANEVIRQRAGILAQNVTRWGEGNTIVTSADVAIFGAMGQMADLLVVDAPCSGEGMFRKDQGARGEWSEENVEHCAARQKRILSDSIACLKAGGYLIYSTCTFNERENEDVVRWLIESYDLELRNELLDTVGSKSELGTHFFPDEIRGEGLFCSVLQIVGDAERVVNPKKSKRTKGGKTPIAKASLYSTVPLIEVEHGGRLWGYSEVMYDMVERLREGRVAMLQAGIEFGELIRGDLKPSHPYALYAYATPLFLDTELTLDQSIDYLHKDAASVELFKEGLQRVTYQGLPLGFVKRIGHRINNLYPTSWRCLQHVR